MTFNGAIHVFFIVNTVKKTYCNKRGMLKFTVKNGKMTFSEYLRDASPLSILCFLVFVCFVNQIRFSHVYSVILVSWKCFCKPYVYYSLFLEKLFLISSLGLCFTICFRSAWFRLYYIS